VAERPPGVNETGMVLCLFEHGDCPARELLELVHGAALEQHALVQVGPGRLPERVVGAVADQEVAKAVAVLAHELGGVGADQLAAGERREPRRQPGLLRCQRLHGPAVEDLALDRATLEHAPLGRVEPVEASREERLQRLRHHDLVSGVGRHRQHLADEEWIPASRSRDPGAQLGRHPGADQVGCFLAAQRLQPQC
jgi:hypothetical protein